MHMVNLSGLATYVNCPEITADHAPIQWLSLTGGSPVRHAARSGRRRGARPNPAIPGGTPERRGGRLPRYSGPGSVPLARGPGRARDPGLDRGGESPDRELAVRDPATRDDPQATDRAVELSQVRRAVLGIIPQLGQSLADRLALRDLGQPALGQAILRLDPSPGLGRVRVLEPAVRIRDLSTVVVVHHVAPACRRVLQGLAGRRGGGLTEQHA